MNNHLARFVARQDGDEAASAMKVITNKTVRLGRKGFPLRHEGRAVGWAATAEWNILAIKHQQVRIISKMTLAGRPAMARLSEKKQEEIDHAPNGLPGRNSYRTQTRQATHRRSVVGGRLPHRRRRRPGWPDLAAAGGKSGGIGHGTEQSLRRTRRCDHGHLQGRAG